MQDVLDNPVYMGKIAYGRRRTEKKQGTRNEMHVVEQSEFPVYEGQHEAIISEEDWYLAQEKRKINSFKREKVNNPDHAHILSGILEMPMLRKEYVRQYRQGSQQGQENTVLLLLQKYGNTYRT